MAQDSGFFNAEYQDGEYDRVYNAEQFAAYFAAFIGNGIFGGKLEELLPLANDPNNMSVNILSGRAWINGWWYINDETLNMPIEIADGILSRKDIIVVRWGVAEREVWLQVIKGEPSYQPQAPEIRRDADYFDLKLCEIDIPAGTSKITQSQITDTRLDNTVCGLVTGVVDQIDTTALYLQFNQQFGDWFTAVKEQFDGDVPQILQTQIDDLFGIISNRIETSSTSTHAYLNKDYFIYDNKLCKATKSIAIGDIISPGTGANNNCIYITIVEEVNTGGVTVVEELADIVAMTTFNGEAAGAKAVKNLNKGLTDEITNRTNAVESLNTSLTKEITNRTNAVAKKVSKSGDTMAGDLIFNNNTNDVPGVQFRSKDNGTMMIDYYNNYLRFYNSSSSGPFAQLMTDGFYANGVNISKHKIYAGTNVAWKNCPAGTSTWYYYEGANTSTYDLPYNHCVVTVYKVNSGRGTAIAIQWNVSNGTRPLIWTNSLWDTWRGWVSLPYLSVSGTTLNITM